jgi:hypothetical protein
MMESYDDFCARRARYDVAVGRVFLLEAMH